MNESKYEILRVNCNVKIPEIWEEMFHHLFLWANEEGLRGNRTTCLTFRYAVEQMMVCKGYTSVSCIVYPVSKEQKQDLP